MWAAGNISTTKILNKGGRLLGKPTQIWISPADPDFKIYPLIFWINGFLQISFSIKTRPLSGLGRCDG